MEERITKPCTRCQQVKDLTAFSKEKRGLYGHKSTCKECDAAKYAERAEHYRARNHARYKSNRDAILEQQRQYRAKNPEMQRAYHHEYYQRAKDEIRARRRAWRAANPERAKQWKRNDYLRHTDRYRASRQAWRAANLDKARAASRTWFRRNRLRRRVYQHRRHARITATGGTFTAAQWQSMVAWFGSCCLRCGATDGVLTIDHVVPVTLGGVNALPNLQPLCFACNSSKGVNIVDYRDPERLRAFLEHG